MRESPDEPQLTVFQAGSTGLCALYRQLGPEFAGDAFIREQLIIYADIPQIETILRDNVPSSSQEAQQRVSAKLSPFKKFAGETVAFRSTTAHPIAFYGLNRRFVGSAKKKFSTMARGAKERSHSPDVGCATRITSPQITTHRKIFETL